MRRMLALTVVGGLAALTGLCTPYQVRFEGDCLPESQPGWERCYGGGGATRWIEADQYGNSYYAVDSLADQMIYEYAEMDRQINPSQPGEVFIAEWRVRIADNLAYYDEGVTFARDGYGTLAFRYYLDRIYSSREGWYWPIAPGEFHTYHLESTDMIAYQLWIDGEHARNGWWDLNSLNQSFVNFGDGVQGAGTGSLAYWDYFRFGVVVPEASTIFYGVLIAFSVGRRRYGSSVCKKRRI